jgi:hypothetical protein
MPYFEAIKTVRKPLISLRPFVHPVHIVHSVHLVHCM